MTIEIQLTHNQIAIVDDCDADLTEFKWTAMFNKKYGNGGRYLALRSYAKGRQVAGLMHRVIMSRMLNRPLLRSELVDHKNRNPLDNRRENLRIATTTQSNANRPKMKHSTQPYKGVRRKQNCVRWGARIYVNGKCITLGLFDTAEEARDAYQKAATEFFGEFAKSD